MMVNLSVSQEIKDIAEAIDLTVAIPTYNGAERLPQILDKLLAQTGIENLRWEVIVVDNNSRDRTPEVVKEYQTKFTQCELKYFLETQQGSAFARLTAVNEAKGKFIAFLDDDNVPAPDWVLHSYNFGEEHSQAGAWSGQIHGDFEVKPPDNFDKIQAFLAIREHGHKAYIFDADNLRLPPSAGLVIRKQAWLESLPKQLYFIGRVGKSMVGGEDIEILLHLHKSGWEIWYNPKMEIYHQIPHWRLERNYLLKIARGCGLSIFQLRLINAKNGQLLMIFLKTILGNLRRIFHHIIKYKNNLNSDIVAIVEVNFYLGSLMSPLYSLLFYIQNLTNKNMKVNNE